MGKGYIMAETNNASENNSNTEQITETHTAETSGENSGKQAETLSFTQDALNALNADAKRRGEQSILKQLKLNDKKELSAFVERVNALFAAEESKESDSDKLIRETNDHTATRALLEAANAELAVYKEKEILTTVGFKDEEDIQLYYPLIKSSVNEENGIDFKVAAEKTFEKYKDKINKQEEKPKPPDGALYAGAAKPNNNTKKTINSMLFGIK